jgi:hypothetical protein
VRRRPAVGSAFAQIPHSTEPGVDESLRLGRAVHEAPGARKLPGRATIAMTADTPNRSCPVHGLVFGFYRQRQTTGGESIVKRSPCARSAVLVSLLVAMTLFVAGCGNDDGGATPDEPVSKLPDLSGLAWLGGDHFVGVHDAKNPDELDRPRVSVLTLPTGPEGMLSRTVDIDWPDPLGPSSDLESVASIPGTDDLLFAESGDDNDPDFRRLFLARWDGEDIRVIGSTIWPVDIFNVEATAVAAVAGGHIFVYAERAEGEPSTQIRWADFEPADLTFGRFSSVTFDNPDPDRANRPVVGMDIDTKGNLYVVSAFDPDEDDGPFQSSIYVVGRFVGGEGGPALILDEVPELIGRVDGFKTESVSVREVNDAVEVFIGTDDENLGNVMRPLPRG